MICPAKIQGLYYWGKGKNDKLGTALEDELVVFITMGGVYTYLGGMHFWSVPFLKTFTSLTYSYLFRFSTFPFQTLNLVFIHSQWIGENSS